ncbi:MAG: tyrosine-type recombinase/integrase, partial [Candidatus Sumerlaeia bacterium]|nr:tyrosine-type recombinase/integrase [Candidatus Sumerlaeia bacterium]
GGPPPPPPPPPQSHHRGLALARVRLTPKIVRSLPLVGPADTHSETVTCDTEVVGLRAHATKRAKYYAYRYSLRGVKRLLWLGDVESISLAEAREMALRARAMVARGVHPTTEAARRRAAVTVWKFFRSEHLPLLKSTIKSWRTSRQRLRDHVKPVLGHLPIMDVTARDLKRLYDELAERTTVSTANRVLAAASGLLKHAVREGIIRKNPASAVRRRRETGARLRFLDRDEVAAFAGALRKEPRLYVRAFLELALLTGLRRSELLGLRWRDLDLAVRCVHLAETKAGGSRDVPISSAAAAVLARLPRGADSHYVFRGSRPDRPLSDPSKHCRRIYKAAGITGCTLHTLRHTFASHALAGGVALQEIAALLGHRSQRTTMIYAHIGSGAMRSAAEAVGEALGGISAIEHQRRTPKNQGDAVHGEE